MINADVIIVGSGPAGCTAAIYSKRAGLDTVIVAGNQAGGQLTTTTDVENYPGYSNVIQGPWLVEEMQKQAENVGAKIIHDHIIKFSKTSSPFQLLGQNGDIYTASALIFATGADAKWLGIADEIKFRGYGVSGCATCDGFFYKNQDVAVIGGGNTAVEEALFLTHHAKKVYLIHRRNVLRAEKILQERLFVNPKIEIIWDSVVENIIGTENPLSVNGIILKSVIDEKLTTINVNGVFVAIGHTPNTSLLKDFITLDEHGYVLTNPHNTETNIPGVYAAGDVKDRVYRQAVTAAASGCMAALDALKFIDALKNAY